MAAISASGDAAGPQFLMTNGAAPRPERSSGNHLDDPAESEYKRILPATAHFFAFALDVYLDNADQARPLCAR
jgi:hypothetical protein